MSEPRRWRPGSDFFVFPLPVTELTLIAEPVRDLRIRHHLLCPHGNREKDEIAHAELVSKIEPTALARGTLEARHAHWDCPCARESVWGLFLRFGWPEGEEPAP